MKGCEDYQLFSLNYFPEILRDFLSWSKYDRQTFPKRSSMSQYFVRHWNIRVFWVTLHSRDFEIIETNFLFVRAKVSLIKQYKLTSGQVGIFVSRILRKFALFKKRNN